MFNPISKVNVGEEEQLKNILAQKIPTKELTLAPLPPEKPELVDEVDSKVTAPLPPKKPEQKNNFKKQMALSESSGRTNIVNPRGYMGKFQFGNKRLTDFKNNTNKKFTKKEFLNNPKLQDEVFDWHVNDIKKFINSEGLDSYIGKTIKGIPITLNGLIAVAHLGGQSGMKKFLETDGKYNPDDRRKGSKKKGTSLSDYLNKFK
tara:strand:- start:197 stop:808 length:612 start_codon:yes stop_codon:yes gene_type:complete